MTNCRGRHALEGRRRRKTAPPLPKPAPQRDRRGLHGRLRRNPGPCCWSG